MRPYTVWSESLVSTEPSLTPHICFTLVWLAQAPRKRALRSLVDIQKIIQSLSDPELQPCNYPGIKGEKRQETNTLAPVFENPGNKAMI